MDIEQGIQDLKKAAVKGLEDARDSFNEATHRTVADAEKTKREVDGENMSVGEHIASNVNELKNRVQADVDADKRDLRQSTEN